ncbi:hypothetical protein N0V93_004728 [Gnomoniopsis smithogilvyi]|uniref:Cytochrome P450 n=1 Tax=Gnomoniopsis smithogilvyi TaxID=1191159 RepID=A0A9W9CWG1_9PEZI|nr:hypothetical protein N0V93_004728 [Gnomoniopsis smithogilvyi]
MILEATRSNTTSGSGSGNFSFFLGKKHVVGIAGSVESRSNFFENKDMSLMIGTAELLTCLPLTKGDVERFGAFFVKSMATLLKRDNFVRNLHLLTGDARRMCENLMAAEVVNEAGWRIMNPFDEEVAENTALGDYTLRVFHDLEQRNSTVKVYLPWFPAPGHYLRMWDGFRLYRVFQRILKQRLKAGLKCNDAFQTLIDSGAGVKDITGFVINALFGGQVNTGVNAAWLPIFLAITPEWKARAVAEVDQVISRYRSSAGQKPSDVLDTLSIDVWQNEFPLLVDCCLRESVRLTIRGAAVRKNETGVDVVLENFQGGDSTEVISDGSYATFLLSLVHFNPDIYPEPTRFDPGRYTSERAEDKRLPYSFLGWGAGRHPCLGTRFAKLEITLIMAYLFALFEFELAKDACGGPATNGPPLQTHNAHFASRPVEPVYLRFKPRPGAFD